MQMHDVKKNPYQQSWWDEKIVRLVVYLSRNDIVWIGVGIALAILYFAFPINWDAVFELR